MADYFYYVRDDGTAAGDAGRETLGKRTGAFNDMGGITTFYGSVSECITQASTMTTANNHYILCSDAHSHSTTSDISYNFANGINVVLISVSDANADQYGRGAAESCITNAGINFDLGGNFANVGIYGFDIAIEDQLRYAGDMMTVFGRDCTFTFNQDNTASLINYVGADGTQAYYQKCDFYVDSDTVDRDIVQSGRSVHHVFDECSFNITSGGLQDIIFRAILGSTVTFKNMDLSGVLTGGTSLMDKNSNQADVHTVTLESCKIDASYTKFSTYSSDGNKVRVLEIGTGSGTDYYRRVDDYSWYTVSNDISNYLAATYDGTNGFSILIEPTSQVSLAKPVKVKIAHLVGQDLSGAGGVDYTINFISENALNQQELWFEAIVPTSSANLVQGDVISTLPANILGSDAHATNAESWTETYTTPVEQEDTISVPQKTGVTNAEVEIWAYLAHPTEDVNICPAIEVA